MENRRESPYGMAKENAVLPNAVLTEWLVELEECVRRLEASSSPRVTWKVSQAELAETEKEDLE